MGNSEDAKCKLSNNLIEGFLFEFLGDGKTIEEIFQSIFERFDKEMLAPSDLNSKGIPKYKSKTQRVLTNGKNNGIYLFDENTGRYRIPS